MRVYYSGAVGAYTVEALRDHKEPPVLLSFYDVVRKRSPLVTVLNGWGSPCFLDSGAFSAMTMGETVDLGALADFYLQHAARFDTVANLDVIGDARTSEINLRALQARGVPALPVWHFTSSLAELHRVAAEHERFAIGGVVPYAMRPKLREQVLDRAWEVIHHHWPRRVHGFGVMGISALLRYAWHSVDGSSPVQATAFGKVLEFNPELGKLRELDGKEATEFLRSRHKTSLRARTAINLGAYRQLEQYVTRQWAEKGVVWDD